MMMLRSTALHALRRPARGALMAAAPKRWNSGGSSDEDMDRVRVERAKRTKVGAQFVMGLIALIFFYDFRVSEPPEVVIPQHVRRKRREAELAQQEADTKQ